MPYHGAPGVRPLAVSSGHGLSRKPLESLDLLKPTNRCSESYSCTTHVAVPLCNIFRPASHERSEPYAREHAGKCTSRTPREHEAVSRTPAGFPADYVFRDTLCWAIRKTGCTSCLARKGPRQSKRAAPLNQGSSLTCAPDLSAGLGQFLAKRNRRASNHGRGKITDFLRSRSQSARSRCWRSGPLERIDFRRGLHGAAPMFR